MQASAVLGVEQRLLEIQILGLPVALRITGSGEDDGLFMIDEIIVLAHGTDMETGVEHVARYFALEEDTLMAELFEGIDGVLQVLSDRSKREG